MPCTLLFRHKMGVSLLYSKKEDISSILKNQKLSRDMRRFNESYQKRVTPLQMQLFLSHISDQIRTKNISILLCRTLCVCNTFLMSAEIYSSYSHVNHRDIIPDYLIVYLLQKRITGKVNASLILEAVNRRRNTSLTAYKL
ncbi:hypothetical protein SAMN05216356_101110 [Oribacterium sp. WCC10]|nr:hypothetical protein SAMN05216356_101110 [Oribacterium sp. WCC10]